MRKAQRLRKWARVRRQRPMPGGRIPVVGMLDPAVENLVRDAMVEFGITRSFVINVGMAKFFGVRLEDEL
jgi:hypothetical protein